MRSCYVCSISGTSATGYCRACRVYRGAPQRGLMATGRHRVDESVAAAPRRGRGAHARPSRLRRAPAGLVAAGAFFAVGATLAVAVGTGLFQSVLPAAAEPSGTPGPAGTPAATGAPGGTSVQPATGAGAQPGTPAVPAAATAPNGSAALDSCLVGSWQDGEHWLDLPLADLGVVRLTGGGGRVSFFASAPGRTTGDGYYSYGSGVTYRAAVEGRRVELRLTGSVTFEYQVNAGTLSYHEVSYDADATLTVDGQPHGQVTMRPTPDRYSCTPDTLRLYGEGQETRLARTKLLEVHPGALSTTVS